MRKAILPLLLIITMVLSASVASATNFSAPGGSVGGSGWTTAGDWQMDSYSAWTDSSGTATHPVETAASGAFDLSVQFMYGDDKNNVKIGLKTAGGVEKFFEYRNGKFYFGGVLMTGSDGKCNVGFSDSNHNAMIHSDDGKVWQADIYGNHAEVTVNAVPTQITLGLTCDSAASRSPYIFNVNYVSDGAPASDPTPTPTAAPTEVIGAGSPPVSIEEIQNYYDDVYPTLYGPQANYLTPGSAANPAATGASGFTISGTVTGAASGNPIEGASVVIGDKLQKTDGLGKFKLEGIPAGNADVAVSADGFAAKTQSVNVDADKLLTFVLDNAATGGAITAGAANETDNATVDVNATIVPTVEPTTEPSTVPTAEPSATQTKSPGFEGIIAAIAMIGAAGVLVYVNRKR